MNHKTFNVAALSVFVVTTVFLGAVVFWPDSPKNVEAGTTVQPAAMPSATTPPISPAQPAVLAKTDTHYDDDFEQLNEAVSYASEYMSLDTANEFPVIEISSSDSGSSSDYTASQSTIGDSFTPFSYDVSTLSSTLSSSGNTSSSSSSASSSSSSGTSSGGSPSGGASEGDTTQPKDNTTGTQPQTPADNPGTPGGGGAVQDYSLPDWIKNEGIRAGFMSSTSGNLDVIPRIVQETKNIGLNTAIVYGCMFAETPNHLTYYREWFRQCNKAGLHIFAFYGWQPPVKNPCRPVVFSDGTEGLFPCPLDDQLWQYLTDNMVEKLARVSVERSDLQTAFDGFFLDMEMYRTETEPNDKRNYSLDTCFCDVCFSRFIQTRPEWKNLPMVRRDRRKFWLEQHNLLSDYHTYLARDIEARAEDLRNQAHAINPKLLFGVYPRLSAENWVLAAVMRGFGRNSYPAISFTTDTYGYYSVPWGAARIPADLTAYFKEYDINGIYVAGYLLRAYTSSEIKNHLVKSGQNAQGYWLFRMPQLLDSRIPPSETLPGGTQADYLREIKNANIQLNAR
ncbi:hypothetical protein ACQ9LF_05515 [Anaerohalosphaeraceae bacterium U12dextr]